MKIELKCNVVEPGPAGNSRRRLVFTGLIWDEWDHTFCVHGEKLRWSCDECDEALERKISRATREPATPAKL